MALAECSKGWAGPRARGVRRYDGSRRAPADRPGADHGALPGCSVPSGAGPGALGLARAYVSGPLDVEGTCTTPLSRMIQAQQVHIDLAERSGPAPCSWAGEAAAAPDPPPPQEVRVKPPLDARAPALQEA